MHVASYQTVQSPTVAVVILNYNGGSDLAECLESLARQDYGSIRIYVVDNGSTDGSADLAEQQFPVINVIRNGANLQWAGGNNVGIQKALEDESEYIWVLNNDVALEPDCVSHLVTFMEKNAAVGVVGPAVYYYDDRDRLSPIGGCVDFDVFRINVCEEMKRFRACPPARRYVSGCAMFVRRAVFEKIGLFDERYGFFCEDTDFGLRAAHAGFAIEIIADAVMYHKIGRSFDQTAETRRMYVYHNMLSALRFWRKHVGWWRFHRNYCPAELGKWMNRLDGQWLDAEKHVLAEARIDALWAFLIHSSPRSTRTASPGWFVHLVRKRSWLVAEFMAFRLLALVRMALRAVFRGKRRTPSL